MTLPEQWIVVWFGDASHACLLDTETNRSRLEDIIEDRSPHGLKSVTLVCVDNEPILVRRSYIEGFFVSTPEGREASRQFEREREEEKKALAPKEWEE